jgi:NitT/TauT family transport system permease protein
MAIALVAGLALGIASGRGRVFYDVIDPWVSALYSIPSVALLPVIAVGLGYTGDAPRIAAVALFAIFPILINTQQGVRNVDPGLLEVARAFSSSERRLWKDVVVPSALPFILAGVRLAIGRGLIGMIVAEFLVGLAGLGYLIIVYQNTFRIDRMFVPVIVVAVIGISLMGFVQFIEGRVAPWLRREQK